MSLIEMDRRAFIVNAAAFAGGMSLSLGSAPTRAAGILSEPFQPNLGGIELSPWIAIMPDDTVIVRVCTPEIGNGTMSQTPMSITEELNCDWSKVRAEFASPKRDVLEKGVYSKADGSQPWFSGHSTGERMKHALQVGASARERLKAAAAAQWQVPGAEIEAKNSVLTHLPTGRKLRYGQVAAQAAAITLETEPKPKPQDQWTFLGKIQPPKLQLPLVVRGAATYGVDVKVPGMVHAALRQSPVQGGKLKNHDPSKVLKMPGVRAVVVIDAAKTRGAPFKVTTFYGLDRVQSGVAVIADHYWQARKALDALPMEWEPGPGGAVKTSADIYDAAQAMLDKAPTQVAVKKGDLDTAPAPAKVVEATYLTPFCDNAVMEPLNATALVTPTKAEVWTPCQDPLQSFWVTVDETGLQPEQVDVHQTFTGGAFGRRSNSEDLRMVVAIAKEYPGVPVKAIWSREETFRQGRYRTAVTTRFRAGLGADGMPVSLQAHSCQAGMAYPLGYSDSPYFVSGIIPNLQLGASVLKTHVLTGAYRGPSYNSHAFIVETFIDECAVAAGVDPLEYRLRLLSKWDPEWSKVLQVAADKSAWGKPLPKGHGRGIAISAWPMIGLKRNGSTVATAVHAEVTHDGEIKVHSIDVAFDCGRVIHRDAVLAQLEGATIFGLNMTLNEEVTLADGAIVEGNFDTYPMLRTGDMPRRINVHFDALSGNDRFSMIGEAPVGPIGPALGNAIFQATGKRLRSTPFRKHDLKWS
jgi:isoquinoline 1-oxidoreductase beta subunit